MPNPDAQRRSLATRLLHATLLLAVCWQLIGSNFIERPRATRPGNAMYEWHEVVGLATLGVVLAFWVWSWVRRRETPLAALFPWFSARRLRAVGDDLARHLVELRQFRLPGGEAETPLASAVHGLGLLGALAMGATGAWLYTLAVPTGVVLDVHKLVANLMWAYLIGHAALAILHQIAGHGVFQRMFGPARAKAR